MPLCLQACLEMGGGGGGLSLCASNGGLCQLRGFREGGGGGGGRVVRRWVTVPVCLQACLSPPGRP